MRREDNPDEKGDAAPFASTKLSRFIQEFNQTQLQRPVGPNDFLLNTLARVPALPNPLVIHHQAARAATKRVVPQREAPRLIQDEDVDEKEAPVRKPKVHNRLLRQPFQDEGRGSDNEDSDSEKSGDEINSEASSVSSSDEDLSDLDIDEEERAQLEELAQERRQRRLLRENPLASDDEAVEEVEAVAAVAAPALGREQEAIQHLIRLKNESTLLFEANQLYQSILGLFSAQVEIISKTFKKDPISLQKVLLDVCLAQIQLRGRDTFLPMELYFKTRQYASWIAFIDEHSKPLEDEKEEASVHTKGLDEFFSKNQPSTLVVNRRTMCSFEQCLYVMMKALHPEWVATWKQIYSTWVNTKTELNQLMNQVRELVNPTEATASPLVDRIRKTIMDYYQAHNNEDGIFMLVDRVARIALKSEIDKMGGLLKDEAQLRIKLLFGWVTMEVGDKQLVFSNPLYKSFVKQDVKKVIVKPLDAPEINIQALQKEIDKTVEARKPNPTTRILHPIIGSMAEITQRFQIDEWIQLCNQPYFMKNGVREEVNPDKIEDCQIVYNLIVVLFSLFVKKTIIEIKELDVEITKELILSTFQQIVTAGLKETILKVMDNLREQKSRVKKIGKPFGEMEMNAWNEKLDEWMETSKQKCLDEFGFQLAQALLPRTAFSRQRRLERTRRARELEQDTIELSPECIEKTKGIVVRLDSGHVPDKKYVRDVLEYRDEHETVYYEPTTWFRRELCNWKYVSQSFVVDGLRFQLGMRQDDDLVFRFEQRQYEIFFKENRDVTMTLIYDKIITDAPEELKDMISVSFIAIKRMNLKVSLSIFITIFYLCISFFDDSFQCNEPAFQKQIRELIPRLPSMIKDGTNYSIAKEILGFEFHILRNLEMDISYKVFNYILDYVDYRSTRSLPFLYETSAEEPILEPWITIQDIKDLKSIPLSAESLKSLKTLSKEDMFATDSESSSGTPSSYDESVSSEIEALFASLPPSQENSRSPSPSLEQASSFGMKKKGCMYCGGTKKVIPTFQFSTKKKIMICEKCVSKNKLKL